MQASHELLPNEDPDMGRKREQPHREPTKRWSWCICGSLSLAIAAFCIKGIIASDTLHTPDGRPYLSSWGIGKMCLALSAGGFGIFFVALAGIPGSGVEKSMGEDHYEAFRENHILLLPISVRPLCGLDQKEFCADVLKIDLMRILKFMCLLGRACLNSYFVFQSFMLLPERNPDERLNEARYYVAWTEMLVVGGSCAWIFISFLAASIMSWGPDILPADHPSRVKGTKGPWKGAFQSMFVGLYIANVVYMLKFISTFSVLQLVANSSPLRILETMKVWYLHTSLALDELPVCKSVISSVVAMLVGAIGLVFACLGTLGLIIKINQVDFVTRKTLHPTSPITDTEDFIALVGLASAVAGVADVGAAEMSTVFELAAHGEDDEIAAVSKARMAKQLVMGSCLDMFNPLKAWVVILTLDATDFKRLIFAK